MGRDENDNPVRRHVRGRTRLTVTDKVAALENQRAKGAGRSATNSRQTVGGWLDEWLLLVRRSRKARTFTTYDSLVRTHCAGIRTTPLNRLTIRQLDDLLNHVATTVSPTSAANLHRTLRAAFSVAVRRGLIPANPCRYATVPRVPHVEVEPLTLSEVRCLLAAAGQDRNPARWSVALALGLRQGEALALQWCDVDLDAATVTVRRQLQRRPWEHGCSQANPDHRPKTCDWRTGGGLVFEDTKSTAGRRVIALPPQMLPLLREQRRMQAAEQLAAGPAWADQDLVFARVDGRAIDPRADHRAWKRLLARAGVRNARLHDARHTAATLLLAQGVDGRVVMSLMGWSQAVLLTRYQHVVDSMRTEAATKIGTAIWGNA